MLSGCELYRNLICIPLWVVSSNSWAPQQTWAWAFLWLLFRGSCVRGPVLSSVTCIRNSLGAFFILASLCLHGALRAGVGIGWGPGVKCLLSTCPAHGETVAYTLVAVAVYITVTISCLEKHMKKADTTFSSIALKCKGSLDVIVYSGDIWSPTPALICIMTTQRPIPGVGILHHI